MPPARPANPFVRKIVCALGLSAALGLAQAHSVWLEPLPGLPGTYQVQLGGHGKLERYPLHKVKSVAAFDADGRSVDVKRSEQAQGLQVSALGKAAVMLVHFDGGIWSRAEGKRSVNLPMTEVSGAISGVHAVKYHKTIIGWGSTALRSWGQPFELIPLDPAPPRGGTPMRLRVLIDGRPASGIKIGPDEDAIGALSDDAGIAVVVPQAGANKVWAGRRTPVPAEPRFSTLSIEYSLSFHAEPAQ